MSINTAQKRLTAINLGIPFRGPGAFASTIGFTEGNRRGALFSYAGTTFVAGINPYSLVTSNASVNHSILWNISDPISDNDTLKLGFNTGTIEHSYVFDGIGQNIKITEIYHVNRQLTGTNVDTHDLTNLTMNIFGFDIPKTFYSVKSLTVINHGTGDLPIDFSSSGSFNSPFGGSTGIMNISSGGSLYMDRLDDGWLVDENNKDLKIGHTGDPTNTRYELVVLGVKPWI